MNMELLNNLLLLQTSEPNTGGALCEGLELHNIISQPK